MEQTTDTKLPQNTNAISKEDVKHFFKQYPTAGKYSVLPAFLSPSECETLIQYSEPEKLKIGVINQTKDINYRIRKNKVRFLKAEQHSELAWLFDKVNKAVKSFNESHKLSPLKGLQSNSVQLGRYSKANFYNWHQDSGASIPRRLSFSIQLSSSDAYQGGKLQLFTKKRIVSTDNTVGTLTIFSSDTVHRVTPIVEGIRYSLVGWFM